MQLQALALGFEVDVWKSRRGAVHSCFDHAINLLVDGELWTLLDASRKDAPFGIRLAALEHASALGVKASDRVAVRAGYVRVGASVVDCRTAARWLPARWGAPAHGLDARLCFVERQAQLRAWAGSAAIASDVTRALCGSDAELGQAVRRSVGRGPGLTPSGDDVLVGILLALTSSPENSAAVAAAARLARALTPLLGSTPDISRHLLVQAARGLPCRALYDLGRVCFEGAPQETLAQALAPVLDTGCSSGADACLGLAAGCRLTFVAGERLAS